MESQVGIWLNEVHTVAAEESPINPSLPDDYGLTLKEIQQHVRQARARAILSANAGLVWLYWQIGRIILDRQTREAWGAKVVECLARDLRRSFPNMQGFSTRNLLLMRGFAENFPDPAIVKQLVSQLPWGHIVRLTQRVKDPTAREWYQNTFSSSCSSLEMDLPLWVDRCICALPTRTFISTFSIYHLKSQNVISSL